MRSYLERLDEELDRFLDARFVGFDGDVGVKRWFVGRVDTGKALDDTRTSLLVQTLYVSFYKAESL